jgi:acetyltransferase-like isoleucine patch superfamily enzyme
MYERIKNWILLTRYKMKGLQVADDCRFSAIPDFGSEPYLISIGKHVGIASGVTFLTHDGGTFVFRHLPKYKGVINYGRITIYDNCMIGLGTIILPGVSIGPNSVIGAHSVVTKTVPPNTVAAGVPARPIMSVEEYAEKCLENTPAYDETAYRKDKRKELLRLFPRPW